MFDQVVLIFSCLVVISPIEFLSFFCSLIMKSKWIPNKKTPASGCFSPKQKQKPLLRMKISFDTSLYIQEKWIVTVWRKKINCNKLHMRHEYQTKMAHHSNLEWWVCIKSIYTKKKNGSNTNCLPSYTWCSIPVLLD